MSDPTLATVDDEPWNESPARKIAPVVAIEKDLSIYARVLRGVAILTANGAHANHVYDITGHGNYMQPCWHCDASGMLSMWQEWVYAPDDATAKAHGRHYAVGRTLMLCESCRSKLRALPLGERWKGKGDQ
jgi:hypothetical protein